MNKENDFMTTGDAIRIVSNYGASIDAAGFIEALESMDENLSKLNEREQKAYRITIGEMNEFC